uniref:C2H2-type domain-containing protein n=1 Tax=Rhodosorus marinus TaxID=101924 RepID=A0A7S2ZIV3_9RHOD|mmetsp:Transcript_2105/g.8282  ORF Transcript_2105/g.8282 Transcript_2105/m.8282 type:complete len:433 (+) Transcript_2105:399-1697(+)|eukprot:CAMPEP_0113961718 /NCGR_PEP_ID=MMETSP0011_2-20120614/5484_1 /TAXON_ID=101924 /ORGANISM="Rhodosorus marinus" /LENGTH=432 /DNA_ID=CAMNT_0000973429 /DNA_START=301 /DNA_END=1599 /DNA_ORIENTATION=+ /assembly_acc=CAM_ASM_000156
MEFEDMIPVADEVLKDYMLHKGEVKVFDFGSAAPLMIEVKVIFHEEVMRSPFYGILKSFENPIFVTSVQYKEKVRIGMGWSFEDSGPLIEYPTGNGGWHSTSEVTTRTRICFFEHKGCAHLLSTPRGGDTPGQPFIHVVQKDGETNYQEVGILNEETGAKIFGVRQSATRPCVFCSARDEPCLCSRKMISTSFGPTALRREKFLAGTLRFDDEAFKSTSDQWLSGRWNFHVNDMPAFSTHARVLYAGTMFENAKNFLCQREIMKSAILYEPVSSSSDSMALEGGQGSVAEFGVDLDVSDGMSSDAKETYAKVYECKKCDTVFRRAYDLKRHDAGVHQTSRSFACEKCSRTFKQKGHLNEHMKAFHSEAGGHECEVCGKRFGVKSKLLRHVVAVHTNMRLFPCKYCGKKYKEKHLLNHHLRHKHPNENPISTG